MLVTEASGLLPSQQCLKKGVLSMLWTIFAILLILWLLGLVANYTLGGLIHLLLVVALIIVVVRLLQGRRVV
jgi:hypothetical protein